MGFDLLQQKKNRRAWGKNVTLKLPELPEERGKKKGTLFHG